MFKKLVIAGGGIYGFAYLGAITRMKELKMLDHIQEYVGTSIGSILCVLLALNDDSSSILDWIKTETIISKQDIDITTFFKNFGIDNGLRLIRAFTTRLSFLTNKNDLTFKELYEITKRKVTLIGTNISTQKTELFNYETNPDMYISIAVRISCSIPLIYTPVTYNDNMYVDGGMTNNIPVDCFSKTDDVLVLSIQYEDYTINNIYDYMYRLFQILFKQKTEYENIKIKYTQKIPLFSYDYQQYITELYNIGYSFKD